MSFKRGGRLKQSGIRRRGGAEFLSRWHPALQTAAIFNQPARSTPNAKRLYVVSSGEDRIVSTRTWRAGATIGEMRNRKRPQPDVSLNIIHAVKRDAARWARSKDAGK